MKILIVNFEYPPLGGGGGVATSQVAEELARRHEVHVLTTRFGDSAREEKMNGVNIHRVNVMGRNRLSTASLISLVAFAPAAGWRGMILCWGKKFDVINAQFVVPSGVPAVILAKLFRIPFVLSFIGGDIFDPSKGISPHRYAVLRWLIRLIAKQAQARTAISEDTKRRARELHKVRGDIVVTHLGVEKWGNVVSLPETGGRRYFISVGRLIPRKRYETLLEAWREIECDLIIVGSGPLEDGLKNRIRVWGLDNKVSLTGFVSEDQKRKLLMGAIGYVSAAEHEGFGIVFLEAMQAGLPIVATDTGGQTDFLSRGENALLARPGDVSALRAAINEILGDDALREKMKDNNKRKVQSFYLERTTADFERVLVRAVV